MIVIKMNGMWNSQYTIRRQDFTRIAKLAFSACTAAKRGSEADECVNENRQLSTDSARTDMSAADRELITTLVANIVATLIITHSH